MTEMNITSAQYYAKDGQNESIKATIDGVVWSVPLDPDNKHYEEIMRQVSAGDWAIADAE